MTAQDVGLVSLGLVRLPPPSAAADAAPPAGGGGDNGSAGGGVVWGGGRQQMMAAAFRCGVLLEAERWDAQVGDFIFFYLYIYFFSLV